MSETAAGTPLTILLVEDNPLDVEITLRTLRRAGCVNPVVGLRDGSEALDYLRRASRPDPAEQAGDPVIPGLILLDLNLPRIDGWEILDSLRAAPALAHVPVMVMISSERDIDRLRRLGCPHYLAATKPLDWSQLLTHLLASRSAKLLLVRP